MNLRKTHLLLVIYPEFKRPPPILRFHCFLHDLKKLHGAIVRNNLFDYIMAIMLNTIKKIYNITCNQDSREEVQRFSERVVYER